MQLTHSVYIATIPNTIVQEDGAGNGRGVGESLKRAWEQRRENSLIIKLNEPEVDVYLLTFIDKHITI